MTGLASMSQRTSHSHMEAMANVIIGSVLGQVVLWIFGMPITKAVVLNAVLISVSYARAYVLRRIFNQLNLYDRE